MFLAAAPELCFTFTHSFSYSVKLIKKTYLQLAAFLGFWYAMSFLPPRTSPRRRKRSEADHLFFHLPQLPRIGIESSDNWAQLLTQS